MSNPRRIAAAALLTLFLGACGSSTEIQYTPDRVNGRDTHCGHVRSFRFQHLSGHTHTLDRYYVCETTPKPR